MELSRIVISELNNQQVIFLREIGGHREFPIVIGIFEATSIDRRVKGVPSPRPLTHDIFRNAVEALGATIEDVYIHHVQEQTFYASIRIRQGDALLEIDARPSDAIAIAVMPDLALPILVEESVIDQTLAQQS